MWQPSIWKESTMQEPKSKAEMLQWVNDEWEALNELLARIPPAEREQPGVEGGDWSIKDLMAHVTAWEKLMVQWLQEAARGETPQRPVPGLTWDDLDLLNQRIFDENHNRPLAEVEADFHAFHKTALETVTPWSEADLFTPGRYQWMGDRPLMYVVAGNMWDHYQEHREGLEAWLAGEH
jgi:hypothetical protein